MAGRRFAEHGSTLAGIILAQTIDPKIRVICADPPNPLTGREEHLQNVKQVCSPNIVRVSYDWDVEAVLAGRKKYPQELKKVTLWSLQASEGIDGIIWGCRNSESRGRAINFANNGYIYMARGIRICQPIAKWSAYEVLALACAAGYPINPVYEKMDGFYNLDKIHDGTWWPHERNGEKGGWLKRYYPEHYEQYLAALRLGDDITQIVW